MADETATTGQHQPSDKSAPPRASERLRRVAPVALQPEVGGQPERLSVLITLASVSCAVGIAAYGSSGHSVGAASGGSPLARSELKVSECMRSHRVPSFPDPSGGGGFNVNGTGISPVSPAFRSARQRCFKVLPGSGPGAQPSTHAMAQALAVSECIRRRVLCRKVNAGRTSIRLGRGQPTVQRDSARRWPACRRCGRPSAAARVRVSGVGPRPPCRGPALE